MNLHSTLGLLVQVVWHSLPGIRRCLRQQCSFLFICLVSGASVSSCDLGVYIGQAISSMTAPVVSTNSESMLRRSMCGVFHAWPPACSRPCPGQPGMQLRFWIIWNHVGTFNLSPFSSYFIEHLPCSSFSHVNAKVTCLFVSRGAILCLL